MRSHKSLKDSGLQIRCQRFNQKLLLRYKRYARISKHKLNMLSLSNKCKNLDKNPVQKWKMPNNRANLTSEWIQTSICGKITNKNKSPKIKSFPKWFIEKPIMKVQPNQLRKKRQEILIKLKSPTKFKKMINASPKKSRLMMILDMKVLIIKVSIHFL